MAASRLTLQDLQSDLWNCAQILRGSAARGRRGASGGRCSNGTWTLNISRYVLPPVGADVPPLPEAVAAFKRALAEARAAEDRLRRVLAKDGWLE